MDENRLKELLDNYLSGKGSPEERRLLDSLFESYKGYAPKGEISPLEMETMDRELLFKEIKERIHKVENATHGKTIRPYLRWWAVAASILLLVGMGWGLLSNEKDLNPLDTVVMQSKSTDWGQKSNIVLADGTKVRLNSGSTLDFPQDFKGKTERKVRLQGEAFFEVTPNPDKPFLIETDQLTTKVLGTSFNIRAYAEEDQALVTVATGKVQVFKEKSIKETARVDLTPNEQALFRKTQDTLEKKTVAIGPHIDWKNGIIHITDHTLGEAAMILENWYGIEIHFSNEEIAGCHLTAAYDNQSLAVVMESIARVKGLEYHMEDGGKRVVFSGKCKD
ncbi:MAG: FecR domain-containing protein [Bacteroidota bacterium]